MAGNAASQCLAIFGSVCSVKVIEVRDIFTFGISDAEADDRDGQGQNKRKDRFEHGFLLKVIYNYDFHV